MIVLDYVEHCLHTVFGLYLYPFSEEWDIRLNRYLDEGRITGASRHTTRIHCGDMAVEVWTDTDRFTSGHLFREGPAEWDLLTSVHPDRWFRPRFRTLLRLYRAREQFIAGAICAK